MKMTKKKVFVSALAICIIAILSFSTIAWFSDSDAVTNYFKFATSDDKTPDDIFSIDVYETKLDEDGNTVDENEDGEPDYTQGGNTYADILPGDNLKKDPTVMNTGYYDQYVRVIVTISDATAWINAMDGTEFAIEDYLEGFDETKWAAIDKTIDGETDTVTYVMYYDGVLKSEETITVFTAVKVPTSLTDEEAATFDTEFTIDVKAEAVQAENTGANAVEAFTLVTSTQAI